MGMFDYVKCELPLPFLQNTTFQSKSIQDWPEMKLFTITKDGRLIKSEYDIEVDESTAPFPGFKQINHREIAIQFDGDIEFYDLDKETDEFVEYRATFRCGRCREICHYDGNNWVVIWETEK